jgi:hypothetical protein
MKIPYGVYSCVRPKEWVQIVGSNSKNAVNFSSACTTKRFPVRHDAHQQSRSFARSAKHSRRPCWARDARRGTEQRQRERGPRHLGAAKELLTL